MRGVKDFLMSSLQAMIDYIIAVSTPEPQNKAPPTPLSSDKHERLRIMNALRQRGATAPVLHREAIPLLPHLLDIPRHLAVITSVVVRHSRTQGGAMPQHQQLPSSASATKQAEDKHFAEFSARCLEVEEQALFRVSKLAAKPRRQHSEPVINIPVPPVPTSPVPIPPSPSSPWRLPIRERKTSQVSASPTTKRSRRKSGPVVIALTNGRTPSSPDGSDGGGGGGDLPRKSPRSPRHPPLPDPPTSADAATGTYEGRARAKRAQAVPHGRSTSTDSPLARKPVPDPLLSPMSDTSMDGPDEAGKRRRNFLRSILTRR